MSVIRPIVLALLATSAAFGALVACRSAVNLDVAYRSATSDAAAGDAGEGGVPTGVELEACPCDESAGFGCCVTTNGPSFCTTDHAQCQQERGVFMRCSRFDPNTESHCCWNGPIGTRDSQTAYAAFCDAGAPACTGNADCQTYATSQRTCIVKKCNDQQIGVCGTQGTTAEPACP